jgi:FSR family fosmidomycin resistance protein-like MFS transporter
MFSALGTLGFAVGPFIITRIVAAGGLERTYYIAGGGLLMTAMLWRVCPPLPERRAVGGSSAANRSLRASLLPVWQPLLLLYLITVLRSGLQVTTNNYLPFLLAEQGSDITHTGDVLTVFLLLGGLGGIAGGFLAERLAGRSVTLYSGLLAGPLMIGAFSTTGPLSLILLGLGGFTLLSTMPVIVAMAQELVPDQTSTVSALMMGAAWGVGALSPAVLEPFAASYGFRRVMIAASATTVIAAALAYFLPREERTPRRTVEADLASSAAVGD